VVTADYGLADSLNFLNAIPFGGALRRSVGNVAAVGGLHISGLFLHTDCEFEPLFLLESPGQLFID
jgi:hypothetical protein